MASVAAEKLEPDFVLGEASLLPKVEIPLGGSTARVVAVETVVEEDVKKEETAPRRGRSLPLVASVVSKKESEVENKKTVKEVAKYVDVFTGRESAIDMITPGKRVGGSSRAASRRSRKPSLAAMEAERYLGVVLPVSYCLFFSFFFLSLSRALNEERMAQRETNFIFYIIN